MSNKLIIFDLDGTLLNTIGDLAACCNNVLAKRRLPTHSYDDYCRFVGNGITRLVERALPENLRTEEYITEARKELVELYSANIATFTYPYDGIMTMLERLHEKGVTLAVASNKFHSGTVQLIDHFFGYFNWSSVHGNREGFPLKPDGAILELIMEQCGATPENTWMVGDSGVDMQTARNAGVHSIGVSWGFRGSEELAENGAEYIINTPEELFSIIFS